MEISCKIERFEKLHLPENFRFTVAAVHFGLSSTLFLDSPELPNWILHILRRNYFIHDTIKGHMTELKEVGKEK